MAGLDETVQRLVRAGVIQHFEFTYELCWKFIQRWLTLNASGEDAAFPRTRKDLFRIAFRYALIRDPSAWFEFGDARNITAHTYSLKKADKVYAAAVKFLPEAQDLLSRLEQRNG